MADNFDPDQYLAQAAPAQPEAQPQQGASFDPDQYLKEAKYGTTGQQIITGLEGAGEGALGPLAPAAERLLGVKPEDIRARAEVNPVSHTVGQVAGFTGSLLTGEGIAPLVGKVGEAAVHAAGLAEPISTVAKIAATGIQTGAEMAALQTSDEISKVITQDPNQSLGSAAINIGLSGIIGGVGGAALGSVAPIWKTVTNKLGVEKTAVDFMGETKFLKENPDQVTGAANEVSERLNQTQNMINNVGELKGKVISQVLPEATPEALGTIDAHLSDISAKGQDLIQKASDNAYLKSAVPRLSQDLEDFQKVIQDPNASIMDKWDALNDYKQASQAHANYNTILGGPEEKALSKAIKPFNVTLRESLENPEVWGDAADVQKQLNSALSGFFDTQKDFLNKVTSKELGERVADPNKLQTLLNQAGKGKAGLKANAVNNYLEASQELSDTIKAIHLDNGLTYGVDSQLNPTPILNHVLNTEPTIGTQLARLVQAKGANVLANTVGEGAAGVIGGGAGLLVGHPLAGAYISEKLLGPAFSALARPFAERAVDSEAMKAGLDYGVNVARGQFALNQAAKNVFVGAGEVLPRSLLPTPDSRKDLQASLDNMSSNPQNALQVGGNIGHYLPDHSTAAAAMAATAQNYLNSLKPKTVQNNPLDVPAPINKAQMASYNRQLDIAQQPLLVLKHIQDSTLQHQDLVTLNTIYPGLQKQLVSKLNEELINAQHAGKPISYSKRQGLSQLMGAPLDSTMTVGASQAIMASAMGQQQAQQAGKPANKRASGVELKQINKVNGLYATDAQARQINKRD